jgi:hypothetical protein
VLADDGIWVVQMSYTPLMIEQNAFDNICHEHLEYYTLNSFEYLMRAEGMRIVDAELNSVNGGSIRLFVTHDEAFPIRPRFELDVARMRLDGIRKVDYEYAASDFLDFAKRVRGLKKATVDFLTELKAKGKKVFGYGASTKGNTLLQYYGLDPSYIRKIADRQEAKWGLQTVGTGIPICSEDDMRAEMPDYLFVFPWHFIQGFVEREHDYLLQGGRFIVPLPQLEVIGG